MALTLEVPYQMPFHELVTKLGDEPIEMSVRQISDSAIAHLWGKGFTTFPKESIAMLNDQSHVEIRHKVQLELNAIEGQ